jgi:hypothetical protein
MRYKKNVLTMVMLGLVAALLLFNLVASEMVLGSGMSIRFQGTGTGIACSNDGQHVYVTDGKHVYISHDYGNTGSWTALEGSINVSSF